MGLADEILLSAKYLAQTPMIIEKYPTAQIVLETFASPEEINWDQMKQFSILSQGRFTLCISNLECCTNCIEYGIPFFYGYEVDTIIKFKSLLSLGVSQIRITDPLFFELPTIKNYPVQIRVIANLAYDAYIPRVDGVNGSWIRPEDVSIYEPYVDTIEFASDNLAQEQALFRIYAQEKHWDGDLNMIIKNFDYQGNCRLITPSITQKRLSCGQRCAKDGTCQLCYKALALADLEKLREFKNEMSSNFEDS